MGKRQITAGGTHRAMRSPRTASERPRGAKRIKAVMSAVGVAGVAVAGAAVIGAAPTLSAGPQLMASLHYLRGTNIGFTPTEQQFLDFIDVVVDGADVVPPDEPYEKVPYNAGFGPFSHGGFRDLTYNKSVAQGVELLAAQQPAAGDVIFGYSQGAVAASLYKATHTGNTYLLVGNASRANGGVMQRFRGATIPFVDVTFTGATPNNGVDGGPGDLTIDVVGQYDGWSDFPRYLWNPVAIANAFMGILLVHGNAQTELTAAELEQARASGDPDYYQYHAGSNTHYYVIKTYPIPLLMPLDPFLPDSVIAALDAPLRAFIETAYDRTDYSTPARASLFKPLNPVRADMPTAQAAVEPEAESGAAAPDDEPQRTEQRRAGKSRGYDDGTESADLEVAEDDPESVDPSDTREGTSADDEPAAEIADADADADDAADADEAGGSDPATDTDTDTDAGGEAENESA
ncbi:PE-PPE domain-containing protein [Mycolicibacterium aurum]|uniref:PE-PPE domain-containing protein n=1 Tax=Mycolicibacterium aurum TaxID=1791 RepID=A0A448IGU3_MYCAU|nr:PE-PPE domain-containing protein [Mycolicibacterium aurum]VEG51691.1 PE-PPE domain-containing protein [Mycolicibacterium aurum]